MLELVCFLNQKNIIVNFYKKSHIQLKQFTGIRTNSEGRILKACNSTVYVIKHCKHDLIFPCHLKNTKISFISHEKATLYDKYET